MTELKPCPFCGSKAKIFDTMDGEWYVSCSQSEYQETGIICSCIPSTWIYDTKEDAIEAWNRRASDG